LIFNLRRGFLDFFFGLDFGVGFFDLLPFFSTLLVGSTVFCFTFGALGGGGGGLFVFGALGGGGGGLFVFGALGGGGGGLFVFGALGGGGGGGGLPTIVHNSWKGVLPLNKSGV